MDIRNILKTGYALVAIATLTAGLTGTAHGASVAGADIKVQYQRSSLDTVTGASALLKRIEAAAATVCAPLDQPIVAARARRDECRRALTETAVSQVNHPMLMTVYASRHQTTSRLLAAGK